MVDDASRFTLHFRCSELDDDLFRVTAMEGREAVSRPFEFRVTVITKDSVPLVFEDFRAIMASTATLTFGPEDEHPIHGVVRDIELGLYVSGDPTYHLVMVPRFSDTKLTRGSWIYLDKPVGDIIRDAFALPGEGALAEGDGYDLSALETEYPPQEYVAQYEESVFDFINRQAEHWGIFYTFDHSGDADVITFGDMNAHFPQLEGFQEIPFQVSAGLTLQEAVLSIGLRERMVEKEVSLREYNYRIPSVSLVTPPTPVDGETGIGSVHVSGEHFWTPAGGTGLAATRSQELFAQKRRMRMETCVRGLRAGHRFTLTGNVPESIGLSGEFIVLSVAHHYGTDLVADQTLPYTNEIICLPYEAVFRPERVTPKPRIYGVMHAKIDAEAEDEANVPCDEWGRYKLWWPWDVAGETGGRGTCWVRMATAAGGSGFGFAQGLHNTTEVVVYHIDGDPDRPVIAGAVMNFEQPSSVRQENANQLVMSSRQGVQMTFTDS